MARSRPLPPNLASAPFTAAEALESGVTPGRLRGRDLDHSVWGVRAARQHTGFVERCQLMQRRMPEHSFFSHVTAARLHGMPVPWHLASDLVLDVSIPAPRRAPHARGIRGHRAREGETTVSLANGLRLSTPERTWCDLAQFVGFADLVAAGDYLLQWRLPISTVDALREAIMTASNRRGIRNLVAALPRLDGRAESPPESCLRLLLIDAGFPPPEINHVVTDRFGEFVARTDFVLEKYRLILEYQGDYHRTTKGQWRADMTRRSRLEAEGWRVMEINADDLRDPAELIARIRRLAGLPVR